MQRNATLCETGAMGEVGFEELEKTAGNHDVSELRNVKSNADGGESEVERLKVDADLQRLIVLWKALPVEIRAGILRLATMPTNGT